MVLLKLPLFTSTDISFLFSDHLPDCSALGDVDLEELPL